MSFFKFLVMVNDDTMLFDLDDGCEEQVTLGEEMFLSGRFRPNSFSIQL